MSVTKLTSREYLMPFILITTLFFLWGMAHGMLDVLNKHFQVILNLSKAQSGLIQFSVYLAYFSMALPAGMFMKKFGYKKGIILGLLLFATGAFLIAETTSLESFWIFLICLFIMGCGLTTLETAANPYTTRLGDPESAERRINLSQSFNGLAWTIGPLIGLYIYGNSGTGNGDKLSSLMLPYLIIGTVVILVAVIFFFSSLPEIPEESTPATKTLERNESSESKPLIKHKHFVQGVIAQFCYVAAQTGIFSYLINFVTDETQTPHFANSTGPWFLSIGFALFMIGRMSGSFIMGYFKPAKILAVYTICICLLLPVVAGGFGWASLISLFCLFFFMSIMFPTIFAMGIKGLGKKTKKASSIIIMSIVGGALFPALMGWIADQSSMSIGFLAPIPLFAFILYYALHGHKVRA